MVESFYDPDSHSCLYLLDAAAGTLVAADIPVEDSVHALSLVLPDELKSHLFLVHFSVCFSF